MHDSGVFSAEIRLACKAGRTGFKKWVFLSFCIPHECGEDARRQGAYAGYSDATRWLRGQKKRRPPSKMRVAEGEERVVTWERAYSATTLSGRSDSTL